MANGTIHSRDFVQKIRNGKSKFTDPNGDIYEGDFAEDYFHGKGIITFSDGTFH